MMRAEPISAAVDPAVALARRRDVSDILRLQAARNPHSTALVFEGAHDSYASLDAAVDRAANGLIAQGLRRGDRVALISHNNRAFVVLRFAIARVGAVLVPVNFMLNAAEMAYILAHAQCRMILAEDALCAVAADALATWGATDRPCFAIAHAGVSPPPGWADIKVLLDHPDDRAVAPVLDEGDVVQIMYTSGTESRPKGTLLTSRALFAQYVSCIVDGGMAADDVELHCMPLYHCAQLDCFLTVDLYLGAKSILLRAPDPAAMLEAVEAQGITKLFCPPTVWVALLRHPDFDRRDLSSLSKGYYGASIMPMAIIRELTERLPGLRLWNFYGQTEMAPVATVLRPEDQIRKLGSAGKPVINVETRIVGDDGADVVPGEVGEIVHRSPQAMLGYLDDPAKTAETFRDGWLHSGDLGRVDEDGYLYVVDRKKDMIKSGGENVSSREVEEALFRHAAVAEVAVIGLPDPVWVEAVTAVVVRRAGATAADDDLHLFCRTELAGYKRPKRFVFIDALPKNASGKVLKRELRERLLANDPGAPAPAA